MELFRNTNFISQGSLCNIVEQYAEKYLTYMYKVYIVQQ